MRHQNVRPARITTAVPSVVAWDSFAGAYANLLLFGLAALAGEWVVHQLEYLIEYRSRFGTVMATTPHHLYMVPIGILLGALSAGLALLALAVLGTNSMRRRRLLRYLPQRLAQLV